MTQDEDLRPFWWKLRGDLKVKVTNFWILEVDFEILSPVTNYSMTVETVGWDAMSCKEQEQWSDCQIEGTESQHLLDCRDYFFMRLLVEILFLFLTYFLMPHEELKNNPIYSNVLVIAHNLWINHKGINLFLVTNINMEELMLSLRLTISNIAPDLC